MVYPVHQFLQHEVLIENIDYEVMDFFSLPYADHGLDSGRLASSDAIHFNCNSISKDDAR